MPIPKIIGLEQRFYPEEDFGFPRRGKTCFTVVLVEGDIGDYTAYAGLSENQVFVARHGDKISFEEACCYFSGLKTELYRR